MSARHRWFLWGGFALLVALYWGTDGEAAVVPIMGLGDQKEEEEAPKEPVVKDSTISEDLKQRLLFMPFRDKSKYKGEWDIYSAMPRGLADSLYGSAFFSTVSIDSALVRLKKKELQGKLDVERALAIGREVAADYVVLGQIDEMSMKRFRATVPIGGYRSYQGLTTVRLYPYKVIDGESAGEVIREVVEDSKRYGVANPAATVPLEKEYFLLGQMEWGQRGISQHLAGQVGEPLSRPLGRRTGQPHPTAGRPQGLRAENHRGGG